ncbi:LPXTG cell wall anchor domain-containing protein [Weissella viridescens]|uniref:LPXTG cell wall anchor domain-containing protein n=1 Tax=Weissella viridescens TaxID=1629 RepID=A0A3P2RK86_WEIVI|nr:collagen binding domain-containing protein [Weissella viridescens]RRG18082.1 LPXTG cell wall anchor domain-containing protein [Weissella viridescens]
MNILQRGIICLLVVLGGIVWFGGQASAQELSQTGVLDEVKVANTQLAQGQQTSVNVQFSSKMHQRIQPGDTITLSMPPELKGLSEQNGEPRRVKLGEVGDITIYTDKAVVTFNETVDDMRRVHGNFSFGIETKRTHQREDASIVTNFGTTLAPVEMTVRGEQQPVGDLTQRQLPFFYKVGDQLGAANQVRWFLNVNLNKADLGDDIVIEDTSGLGQILNIDSFRILIDDYLGRREITLADFVKQGYGRLTKGAGQTFTMVFNREKARLAAFNVSYTTMITDLGLRMKELQNHYELKYAPIYGPKTDDQGVATVQNLFVNGEANGDRFEIHHAEEHVLNQSDETTTPLPDFEPIKPIQVTTSEELSRATEQAQVTQPEVHASESALPADETVTEFETPKLEEPVQPVVTEELTSTLEKAEVTQPEVRASESAFPEDEMVTEFETPKLEEPVQPVVTEEPTSTSEKAEVTQPEVHASESTVPEDETVTEFATLKLDEPVQPKVTEEPTRTSEKAEVTQPEVYASESMTHEDETVTEFETPKLEEPVQPVVTEEPTQTSEKAEVHQPEVHASESTVPEDETISEIETPKLEEPVQPTVIEEPKNTTETVEVTQPEVHVPEVTAPEDEAVSELETPKSKELVQSKLTVPEEETTDRFNFEKEPKFDGADHTINHATKHKTYDRKLPATGYDNHTFVTLLGMMLFIISGLGVCYSKK